MVEEVALRGGQRANFKHLASLTASGTTLLPPGFINSFGGLGIIEFWRRAFNASKNWNDFDIVWMHQPLMISHPRLGGQCVVTYQTTYKGYRNSPTVVAPWLDPYYCAMESLERRTLRIIASERFRVTAAGASVVRELASYNVGISHAAVIPNGVDTDRFRPDGDKDAARQAYGLPANRTILLCVARISPQKGLERLLRAFRHLESLSGDFILVIAGKVEGRYGRKLLALSEKLRSVRFVGFVRYENLPLLYRCADAFVFPSVYEGMPLAVLEAMASGLPILCSDIEALDFVEAHGAGTVIPFDDPHKAGEKMRDFMSQDTRRFAESARRTACNYTWSQVADEYLSLFEGREAANSSD